MVHCAEFYEKWQEQPNWCNKCPSSVHSIGKYLLLVEKLKDYGIPAKSAYAKISENQVRQIPAKRMDDYVPEIAEIMKTDSKIYDEGLRQVLKKHKTVHSDYDENEIPLIREPHMVTCPYCNHDFVPERKRKNTNDLTAAKKKEDSKHEKVKKRLMDTLSEYNVEWETFDLNAEYDTTINFEENLKNIKTNLGISDIPSNDEIDHRWKEYKDKT